MHVCQYCQQLCQLEYLIDYLTGPYNSEEIWKCPNHPVPVRYIVYPPYPDLAGGSVIVVSFLLTQNQKRYSIDIYYPDQTCLIHSIEMDEYYFHKTELARFPFHHQINPINAQHKLSMLLAYL